MIRIFFSLEKTIKKETDKQSQQQQIKRKEKKKNNAVMQFLVTSSPVTPYAFY